MRIFLFVLFLIRLFWLLPLYLNYLASREFSCSFEVAELVSFEFIRFSVNVLKIWLDFFHPFFDFIFWFVTFSDRFAAYTVLDSIESNLDFVVLAAD